MSYPTFADIDKAPSETLGDDFDSKFTFKIKTAGPWGVTLTTNNAYTTKDNKLSAKISGKYAHPNGFAVEKFEVAADGKITTETSLVNTAPGLKLEFKGNDTDKGDISLTYKIPAATITAEVDALAFSRASVTATGGHGAVTAGASVDVKISKQIDSTSFGLALGYSVPKFFLGIKSFKNLTEHKGIFSYAAAPNITLLGLLNHSAKGTTTTLGGVYKCNPNTVLKLKAASTGIINASAKQSFPGKFAVVSSIEVPTSLNGYKLGVNATLG